MQQFYTSSLLVQGQGVPVVIRWLTFNLAKILKIIPEEAPGTQGRGREAPEETLRKRPSDELQQQGMRCPEIWLPAVFCCGRTKTRRGPSPCAVSPLDTLESRRAGD